MLKFKEELFNEKGKSILVRSSKRNNGKYLTNAQRKEKIENILSTLYPEYYKE